MHILTNIIGSSASVHATALICLALTATPALAERQEFNISKTTAIQYIEVDNKSLGLITIEPKSMNRQVTLSCQAVSTWGGAGGERWMRLEVASNLALSFNQRRGIDHASRIQTGDLSAVVPAGSRGSIRIDHTNQASDATELNCLLRLEA